jgi:hypothetical protein
MRIGIIRTIVSIILLGLGVGWVGYYYGFDNILGGIKKLSPLAIALVFALLLSNALAAALRFKVVSNSTGHRVRFRQAMATVGAGSLAGALFFQIAGQLIARGFVMRRTSMPFAAVVAVTLYERIVAAMLSGLLALAGALYIFGKVYLDPNIGGIAFIKITCGLIAATTAGALLGFGNSAARSIAPFITRRFVHTCLRIVALTLLVQIPMMLAYVVTAYTLSPQTAIVELVSASAVVMFAASVPISFAGWGVRELSAIMALGAIGVAGDDALTAAIVIGAGSMLSMAVISVSGLWGSSKDRPVTEPQAVKSFDYEQVLAWCLPIIAAVFVLFQIYVPIGSGMLNVNLADPVAILAGALFVLHAISQRQLPQWRVGYLNLSVAVATVVLGGSLLLGAYRFGWTDWALVNRFFGWFILLAFAATGALIVTAGGRDAFKIILLTYVGATAGVALLEIILVLVSALGVSLPPALIRPTSIEAFSQNHNFFAFQLLMAMAAALVLVPGRNLRILLWTVMLVAFWFAGSRSGWISIACVLAASIYLRAATIREIAMSVICAACVIVILATLQTMSGAIGDIQIEPSSASTQERMITIIGGWKLFIAHPIFGAGLGAFRNEHILATSGIPLVIHSTALWLLAELGLVGFLIFSVPAVYVWATEWFHARHHPESAVIALCFVAFAVMSAPADMVYQRTFWLLIGTALALQHRSPRQKAAA